MSHADFCRAGGDRYRLFRFAKDGAGVVADRMYGLMETALAGYPDAYPFDDLTLSVMVRRRA